MTLPLNADVRPGSLAPLASEFAGDPDDEVEQQMQPGRTHADVTRERFQRLKQLTATVGGELPSAIDGIPVEQLDQKETNVATGEPKRVKCVQTGEVYPSISAAERAKGLTPGRVFNVLDKEGKRAGGFSWVTAVPEDQPLADQAEPPPARRASQTRPARRPRETATQLATTTPEPAAEISVAAAADPAPSSSSSRSRVTVLFVQAEGVDITAALDQLLQRLPKLGGE